MGFGRDPPVHVQNMPASCVAEPTPCNFVSGFLTPSANPNVLYGALVQVLAPSGNPVMRHRDTYRRQDVLACTYTDLMRGARQTCIAESKCQDAGWVSAVSAMTLRPGAFRVTAPERLLCMQLYSQWHST